MVKKKLLFISSHLPSNQVPQAGQKIANEKIKQFSDEYDVHLVAFYNETEEPYVSEYSNEYCTSIKLYKVTLLSRIIGIFLKILMPVRTSSRYNLSANKYIKLLSSDEGFCQIHFEFTSSLVYLKTVLNSGKLLTVTEHDLTYQSFERKVLNKKGFLRFLLKIESIRQKKWEIISLSRMDKIFLLNRKDFDLLLDENISRNNLEIVPPQISDSFKNVNRSSIEKGSILFWGAMSREENVDGVLWFCNDILPRIIKKSPYSKLYIVGASPDSRVESLRSSSVVVTGFVENPIEFFEKCHVAVAPLRMGAGVKIKVLESLEAKIPVVASSVGGEGIEASGLYIVDDEQAFADKVLELFEFEGCERF